MIIDHRCDRCGHRKLQHDRGYCMADHCRDRCSPQLAEYGPPEVFPTFTEAGRRIDTFTKPGSVIFPRWNDRACGCADCRALYLEVAS
jgi:hypothetical protein